MFSKYTEHAKIPDHKRGDFAVKLLIWLLLLSHVGWICVHLNLVAREQINPWKLGGYGMYTVPHYAPLTHVFLFDDQSQKLFELVRRRHLFNSFQFDRRNFLHIFRCRAPSEESIVAFMDENQHLRYRPLVLALSEILFTRKPINLNREFYTKVQIAWNGKTTLFGYQGEICGKSFEGRVVYHAPS
jgi:hypothetical protein